MKIKYVYIIILLFITFFIYPENDKKVELKTDKEKISYSLGYDIGSGYFKTNELDIDLDVFMMALKAGINSEEPVMTSEEMKAAIQKMQQDLVAKREEKNKALSLKNKKEGELFLNENKKKEGVVVLPSGLQYKIVKQGTGKLPKVTDTVTVNYRGTLINGEEFDSSYSRNQPATFTLNQVIKGWTEGLQYIKEGGKVILYIPPELAYGERGAGQVILPNSTLIFEVELIKIVVQNKTEK
jgi:FKBP-type peptidyl-prolyl cis-trans isomerase FklB